MNKPDSSTPGNSANDLYESIRGPEYKGGGAILTKGPDRLWRLIRPKGGTKWN